ncbi:MAG TPA: carboxypeptidase-like regulatory domain-containing protein, partial [Pyrinomonadaceae bacterium]|nr:carboxypeptidase-like regulatory domain-containing protein [Pyrinomonadaceae bacterium]
MFVSTGRAAFSFSRRCFGLFGSLILLSFGFPVAFAQGSVDYTGTGGRHAIQGRIYLPSGRRADTLGLKVKLESMNSGNLSVFADSNGSFSFKNLAAGSYTIVIDGTDDYDTVRESVYIDDPGSSSLRGRTAVATTPRTFTVPIYLLGKRRAERKSGVLNAALATVPKAAANLYLQALESSAGENNQRAIEQLKSAILIYPQFP